MGMLAAKMNVGLFAVLILIGCDKKPKVINAENTDEITEPSTGIFTDENAKPVIPIPDQATSVGGADVHTVTILEALPTARYVYLRVKEGQEEFWIATNKTEVIVGGTYFYREGLLKTNFESKEHKRVFEKLYLVSAIVPSDHASHTEATVTQPSPSVSTKSVDLKGSVKISELVANPSKYAGKKIQISGQCTKVNINIMGRNWIHLKDGSKDDYDLVVTSNMAVPEGHTVTVVGKVVLKKDFGSGYKYDILVEEGVIVP